MEEVHLHDRIYAFDGRVLDVFGLSGPGFYRFHVGIMRLGLRPIEGTDRTAIELSMNERIGITDQVNGPELEVLRPLLEKVERAIDEARRLQPPLPPAWR